MSWKSESCLNKSKKFDIVSPRIYQLGDAEPPIHCSVFFCGIWVKKARRKFSYRSYLKCSIESCEAEIPKLSATRVATLWHCKGANPWTPFIDLFTDWL